MMAKKTEPRKIRRGYREEHPSDAGKTLNKLPKKIPAVKRTSVKGKNGTGAKEGPAQELPKLLKRK